MIEARPFEDLAAWSIFQRLDPHDHLEAELIRGAPATPVALFCDWRAALAIHCVSLIAHTDARRGATPFAVFALANTGQAGVAQAALLARDHGRFRLPMAALAGRLRVQMPRYAADLGIRRIEARSWADHPTASVFLRRLGFAHECDMPGFGAGGTVTFRQFAWTAPTVCAPHHTPERN